MEHRIPRALVSSLADRIAAALTFIALPSSGRALVYGVASEPVVIWSEGKIVRYRAIDYADRIRVPTLFIDAEGEELFDRMKDGHAAFGIIVNNAPAEYETFLCRFRLSCGLI